MAIATITRNAEHSVISTLSGRAIEAAVEELRERDRLTIGLRMALRDGADINDLSAASGLTVSEIRRRTGRELHVLSELELACGTI